MKHLKGITLGPDEVMVSYDVRALFTSVPIKPALEVIKKRLKEDPELQKRTTMSTKHIMDLLEFCLRSTYFKQNIKCDLNRNQKLGMQINNETVKTK